MSNFLTQVAAVTMMNVRSLPQRKMSTIVALVGIAGVVAVFVGILAISEGFRNVLDRSAAADIAIVLHGGNNDEFGSSLTQEQVRLVAESPAIARDRPGPLASAELYVLADVPMRTTNTLASIPVRGVGPQGPKLHEHFKIVEGRYFRAGSFEMIIGRGASLQYAGLNVGNHFHSGAAEWTIVGIFEDGGSISQSEAWTDASVLQGAYNRGAAFQSVRVRLAGPLALQSFKDSLSQDPRLNVHVFTEREFYEELSRPLATLVDNVGVAIAVLMGIGAVFGALNTMYSAVAARTKEIATLRAIGFGAGPLVISVLAEALIVGMAGGLLGALIGWLGFNGIRAATLNPASWAQMTFSFDVTPGLLARGLLWALAFAFIGGLLPSLRAARLPITAGLRAGN
jgi:putative ABC transport system permease protein